MRLSCRLRWQSRTQTNAAHFQLKIGGLFCQRNDNLKHIGHGTDLIAGYGSGEPSSRGAVP
jgi:hypothetical protein